MSPSASDSLAPLHRARALPLPLMPTRCRLSDDSAGLMSGSARARTKRKLHQRFINCTNNTIMSLNKLYSHKYKLDFNMTDTSDSSPSSSSSSLFTQPVNRDTHDRARQSHAHGSPSSSRRSPFRFQYPPLDAYLTSLSNSQYRLVCHLAAACVSFVLSVRSWGQQQWASASDNNPILPVDRVDKSIFVYNHFLLEDFHFQHDNYFHKINIDNNDRNDHPQDSHPTSSSTPSDFLSSSFHFHPSYTQSASVVPLRADRVSLPTDLNVIPMCSVLPVDVSSVYSVPHNPSLLRPLTEVLSLDIATPLRPARVAGSRSEYVQLIARAVKVGMMKFTCRPRAVNGVFTVEKDESCDRLIIDAQPANRLFVKSPHVDLPNPSHIVQLQVPANATVYVAKSDLSDFYHHIGLPEWMQPYFALPSLTRQELHSIGIDMAESDSDGFHPMCCTLPMGFSHAVYLAQSIHCHVLYSHPACPLRPSDNLLSLSSPLVSTDRVHHGICIDDVFLFSSSQSLCESSFDGILSAYRSAGFVVKPSKLVRPTTKPVKVIGLEVDPQDKSGPSQSAVSVSLTTEAKVELMRATWAVLIQGYATANTMSRLIGKWTWLLLIRRPALSVLQHVYTFILHSRRLNRRFTLWRSVRTELMQLLSLLPLLRFNLSSPVFHRLIASDASEHGCGVVATPLTRQVRNSLWKLCSSSRHVVAQTQLNPHSESNMLLRAYESQLVGHPIDADELSQLEHTSDWFESQYATVSALLWRVIISKRWQYGQSDTDSERLNPAHINQLELRAVLLALHWALSYPSAMDNRVMLLLDSTVSLYSLCKGRSSRPQLLIVLRKISALLLASGVSLMPAWVPSKCNPADDASRLRDGGTGREHEESDQDQDQRDTGSREEEVHQRVRVKDESVSMGIGIAKCSRDRARRL